MKWMEDSKWEDLKQVYMAYAQRLVQKFKKVFLEQVPREKNRHADALAKWGSHKSTSFLGVILLEIQAKPSVLKCEVMEVEVEAKVT